MDSPLNELYTEFVLEIESLFHGQLCRESICCNAGRIQSTEVDLAMGCRDLNRPLPVAIVIRLMQNSNHGKPLSKSHNAATNIGSG